MQHLTIIFCLLEHGVDEVIDVSFWESLGLGNVDKGVEQLWQFTFVDVTVLVVVAHVENDAKFVVGSTLKKDEFCFESLVKCFPTFREQVTA